MKKLREIITLKNGKQKKVTVVLDNRRYALLKAANDEKIYKAYITEEYYIRNMEDCARHNNISLEMIAEEGKDVEDSRETPLDGVLDDEERNEKKKLVQAALQVLTKRERELILLYFFEEKTLAEAGEEMGVSEVRAWQLYHVAIEKLKNFLENP